MEIKATPISFSTTSFDCISWSSSPNGIFDLKDAYTPTSIQEGDNISEMIDGDWVWKVTTIPKIQCFIWQCLDRSIPVREVLHARGMEVPQTCPICNEGPETILHCLRDYREAQALWKAFPPPLTESTFYGTNLVDWLKLNYRTNKLLSPSSFSWRILSPFGLWALWLRRNKFLFRNAGLPRNLRDAVISRAFEFAHLGISAKFTHSQTKIQVRWYCPPMNWHKLNSDGSSLGNLRLAGGGGLIRNEKGD